MKIIKEDIYYSEEIVLCKDCLIEVEQHENDWDSFEHCPGCDKDNFTGNLKTIEATKQQITRVVVKNNTKVPNFTLRPWRLCEKIFA